MDKLSIVKALQTANRLSAIEGANPYSISAHKKSAEAILASPLTIEEIQIRPPGSIPGVGRETLAMIGALQQRGMAGLLERLNIDIPTTAAELVDLPGIGPKTAHTLVHQHNIHSSQELQDALKEGRLQGVSGLGPNRLARLRRDLAVYLRRLQTISIAVAWPLALQLQETLAQLPGVTEVSVTGEARRLVTTCQCIELLVAMDEDTAFVAWYKSVGGSEEISEDSREDSKNQEGEVNQECNEAQEVIRVFNLTFRTVQDKIPVRISSVPREQFAAQLMKTTGDATHQAVMEGLLAEKGIQWTEQGFVRAGGDVHPSGQNVSKTPRPPAETLIRVDSEGEIYELIGLPCFPPEVREGQGLLCQPAELVARGDLQGDLHVHSTWSDGQLSIREIVKFAEKLGYEYIAITDHSQSLAIAGGLTPVRVYEQRAEIEEIRKMTRVKILHGIEVNILSDGRLDLHDDILLDLDIVVASVHSSMQQSKAQMTDRIVRAIRHPAVDIIGHLTGRIIGRRSGYEVDIDRILTEARDSGVMLELNANPNRLDVSEDILRRATAAEILVPINTDAHHPNEFQYMDYGIRMARRGWLAKGDVLNALPYEDLVRRLHKI